jgi:hypothetical protein
MTQITLTVSAVACLVVGVSPVAEQSGNRRVCSKNDGTPDSTVSANRLAFWPSFCPHKRDNPRTAVTGAKADTNPVYKHGVELTCAST